MVQNLHNVKSLTINNIEYAKYLYQDGLLFLKIKKRFNDNLTDGNMEDICEEIIYLIDKIEVKGVAYLNIN